MNVTGVSSPYASYSQQPPVNLEETLKKLMKNADKDGDGQLNQQEFAAIQGTLSMLMPTTPGELTSPTDAFTKADTNGDGKVSMDELKGYIVNAWQKGMQALHDAGQRQAAGSSVAGSGQGLEGLLRMTLSPVVQMTLAQIDDLTSDGMGSFDQFAAVTRAPDDASSGTSTAGKSQAT